jgi:drug/metabolite transporter (DMT)-like permease
MVWQLSAQQVFYSAVIGFGVLGFRRGWRREIISLAFILTGILFLILGSLGLAQFVFINLPRAMQALFAGVTPTQPAPTMAASDPRVAVATAITFIVVVALSYLVSQKIAPKPANPAERIWGVIPAVISGYAILYFITQASGKTSLLTFNVGSPNQDLSSGSLLVIFVVVVVAIVVGLIAAGSKKSSPPKKP